MKMAGISTYVPAAAAKLIAGEYWMRRRRRDGAAQQLSHADITYFRPAPRRRISRL